MDDFDRALKRLDWENEPAGKHQKELESKATMLLGELRADRRLLEESQFSDLAFSTSRRRLSSSI
jgi:hypothetical protein